MTAFDSTRMIEERSRAILLPFIDGHSNGRFVVMEKGPLARAYQEQQGDVLFSSPSGRAWSAELKAERDHTGNLFLETWSNRNLEEPTNHHRLGSNPGWMLKLRSDLLLYHFLDTGILYILPLFRLQQWAFGTRGAGANIYRWPEKPQGRYSQANDTHGRCVPVDELRKANLIKVFYPAQVEMFPERTGAIS